MEEDNRGGQFVVINLWVFHKKKTKHNSSGTNTTIAGYVHKRRTHHVTYTHTKQKRNVMREETESMGELLFF